MSEVAPFPGDSTRATKEQAVFAIEELAKLMVDVYTMGVRQGYSEADGKGLCAYLARQEYFAPLRQRQFEGAVRAHVMLRKQT